MKLNMPVIIELTAKKLSFNRISVRDVEILSNFYAFYTSCRWVFHSFNILVICRFSYVHFKILLYIPMLCWLCCNTVPKAIRSFDDARFSDWEYPSPKYDASATAFGGTFEISVKIFDFFSYQKDNNYYNPLVCLIHN